MNFCSNCGQRVSLRIPPDDSRERFICDSCASIHYQNPNLVAGCIPLWQDQVLLCRRAIEPRKGFWTLPAGFMENQETLEQAAQRETLEEACAQVKDLQLYTLFSLAKINQVHVFFRAQLCNLEFAPGLESLEVQLFSEQQIPWNELAFPTIGRTLELFFAERKTAEFSVHNESFESLRAHLKQ